MRTLHINAETCQGHAMCAGHAPSLIDVDDLGFAFVLGDGQLSTPEEVAAAEKAAASCPERAITVGENA